jgi:hypothetical protein
MIKEFLRKEAEFLESLRSKNPNDVVYIKSFMESKYLSEKAVKELPLLEETHDREERKIFIRREAISAFKNFLSHYYDAVKQLYCVATGSETLSTDDFLDYLHAQSVPFSSEEVFNKEPFFEWFIQEGQHHLNNILRKLHVETIEEFALLIRHLDYYGAYLYGYKDSPEEVLSSLYDTPAMLEEDLNQASLLLPGLELSPRPMMKHEFSVSITYSNRKDTAVLGPGKTTLAEPEHAEISFKEKPEVCMGGELIERSKRSWSPDSAA